MKQPDFMSHDLHLPELTLRGMLLGLLITVIFTASNVYLGLKVGLTFSSSIPAAVISMAILRMYKDSNVLENNLVQTQASAAGTLSAIIFILPGLLMLGYWQGFPFIQTLFICACGGCLGVLFTIPLRRAMVVNSELPYPEGLAAAEILKVGSNSESSATNKGGLKDILSGGIVAAIIALCSNGFRVLSAEVSYWLSFGAATTQIPLGFSSALLGAGYLIGIASGIAILSGLVLAWLVFVPYLTSTLPIPDGQSVSSFASYVWAKKVRFIGAGTIGIAAIWTLLTFTKPIIDAIKLSIKAMKENQGSSDTHRMDTDMSPKSIAIVFIVILIGLLMTFYSFIADANLSTELTLTYVIVGVIIAIGMGFFVAATCGYMAGLIGTSASPISGIGILGIIVSSLVVLGIGTSASLFDTVAGTKFATALAIFITSVIVAIAAISNDNLQDLKTGYLVGATPWKQQVALLIGSVAGAFAIAPVLNLLYEAYGFAGAMPRVGMDEAQALSAPQATLMTTIAQGIFSHNLEWDYILFGALVGIVAIIINYILKKTTATLSLPPLAIGMGIYLPPTLEMPLVLGSVLGYFMHRYLRKRAEHRSPNNIEEDVENCNRHGVLFASGLIVGESLMGVIIAVIIVFSVTSGGGDAPLALVGNDFGKTADILGLLAFIAVIIMFIKRIVSENK
ncbi:OPT family oligopeptide transporter [Anaerosinus gibii]|uniref:Oligopeptide transporter, OPT family n=1 Tax=Selenobaculum gibii TaxID=3054208 RepID=A0A9Y2AJ04_9FIRM|nr:oligopeptide transporter, OPT family [Selenobaculum gbiensis]WIW70686.1 oligopeptide transporter, OPT family [Selenobaculum gbiensis]